MSMGGGAWEAGRTMDRSWVQCVTLTALRVAPNLTELTKKNTTNDQQQHENVMTWLHIMAVKRPNAPAMRLARGLQITYERDIWSISTEF